MFLKMNRFFTYNWVLLFLFVSLIHTNCKQKPATSSGATEKVEPNANIEIPGAKRLFDGETLANKRNGARWLKVSSIKEETSSTFSLPVAPVSIIAAVAVMPYRDATIFIVYFPLPAPNLVPRGPLR